MLTKIFILFLFSLSSVLCVDSLDIKTTSGVVRGKTVEVLNQSINQFLNIPYAEPPVGDRRFSKPIPIRPKEVLNPLLNSYENH